MKSLIKTAFGAYRKFLSPLFAALGARCRFYPSCSEYAESALERKRFGKALWLIVWRLLRCGPWSKGGVDPVPEG